LRTRSVQVGRALYEHLGIGRGDRAARDAQNRRNCEFFGAPTVLWLFVHKQMLPFSAHDAGLMLQTLMLSAQAHGVGSCALGVLATWRSPIDAEFVVPAEYQLITGLALGYASNDRVNEFRADHPALALVPSRRAG
jgi:nitroreductase